MDNKKQPLIAHLCMLCAGTCWGLMAPIGKDAMLNGIDGIDLLTSSLKKHSFYNLLINNILYLCVT